MHLIQIKNMEVIGKAAEEFVRRMGDRTVFAFNGKMGTGKTTFIKAICEKLGVTDTINSPTFAIVNEYRTNAAEPVYHFDFYRINTVREACDLGAPDYFDSGAVCFIEWPERIESLLPADTVFVDMIEEEDGSRTVRLSDTSAHS